MADFYPKQVQSMDCDDGKREVALRADEQHLNKFLENLNSFHTRKELCDVILEVSKAIFRVFEGGKSIFFDIEVKMAFLLISWSEKSLFW